MATITARERTTILQALGAGVVPAVGLHHLQVGRKDEVEALVNDLKGVETGSAAVRFVIGRYGSGKTFFLNLVRSVALARRIVVLQADITVERRLHGSGGQARGLFAELLRNLATRSKPEGGALKSLIERWVGDIDRSVRDEGGTDAEVKHTLASRLNPLKDLVGGFDFATVLTQYYEGYLNHNEAALEAALRWLRGEFSTKTEARQSLGVRAIIDDDNIYDHLKLLAGFVRIAGYNGLLVSLDEMGVFSHRLANTTVRNNNFEAILRIVNDCLQGHAAGLAFIFAGTDEFLEDRRRGLYSYEALASRLAANRFAGSNRKDLASPVIRLPGLTPEECYALIANIRSVFALGDPAKHLIPDDGLQEFLRHCSARLGAAYFESPRETARDFVGLLNMVERNPGDTWQSLLNQSTAATASPAQREPRATGDSDLTEFRV